MQMHIFVYISGTLDKWKWFEEREDGLTFSDDGVVHPSNETKAKLIGMLEYLKDAKRGCNYYVGCGDKFVCDMLGKKISRRGEFGLLKKWISDGWKEVEDVDLWNELVDVMYDHIDHGSVIEFELSPVPSLVQTI